MSIFHIINILNSYIKTSGITIDNPDFRIAKTIDLSEYHNTIQSLLQTGLKDYPNLLFSMDYNYVLIRYSGENHDKLNDIEKQCRSVLLQINNNQFSLVYSQFNKIICNGDAKKYILDNKIDIRNIHCEPCFEGTLFTFMWCPIINAWRFHTRSCLDANASYWNKLVSHGELIKNSFKQNNITLPDLTKNIDGLFEMNHCYFCVLVDHLNMNIINYSEYFKKADYSNIIFIAKRQFGSMIDVKINDDDVIKAGFVRLKTHTFESFDSLELDVKRRNDIFNKQSINDEGLILKVYNNDMTYNIMKMQTESYITVKNMKPNTSNKWCAYFELYQKDKLREYLNYFPEENKTVIKIVHTTFVAITKELLQLYHKTRNRKNEKLYELLPKVYKQALYTIHGLYSLKKTQRGYQNKSNITQEDSSVIEIKVTKSDIAINYSDINCYLRSITGHILCLLVTDRIRIIERLYSLVKNTHYGFNIFNTYCNDALFLAEKMNPDLSQIINNIRYINKMKQRE